jgi:hypothetical protein
MLDPKRWAIYQTEAIENFYLYVDEISRLRRKEKHFKNTKTTTIRPKNGILSAIIFVVFKLYPF